MPYKLADPANGGAPFFQHGGEYVPRVNHVWPDFELDVDPGGTGGFGALEVVV